MPCATVSIDLEPPRRALIANILVHVMASVVVLTTAWSVLLKAAVLALLLFSCALIVRKMRRQRDVRLVWYEQDVMRLIFTTGQQQAAQLLDIVWQTSSMLVLKISVAGEPGRWVWIERAGSNPESYRRMMMRATTHVEPEEAMHV